jgi:hypothetical protein
VLKTTAPAKPPYHLILATVPTQADPNGLRYGNILFGTRAYFNAGRVNNAERCFVRIRIEALQQEESVFSHDYSVQGQEVCVQVPADTLGDTVGRFSYIVVSGR